jgi:hypothetical protein
MQESSNPPQMLDLAASNSFAQGHELAIAGSAEKYQRADSRRIAKN